MQIHAFSFRLHFIKKYETNPTEVKITFKMYTSAGIPLTQTPRLPRKHCILVFVARLCQSVAQ